jgi:hypothetical protein
MISEGARFALWLLRIDGSRGANKSSHREARQVATGHLPCARKCPALPHGANSLVRQVATGDPSRQHARQNRQGFAHAIQADRKPPECFVPRDPSRRYLYPNLIIPESILAPSSNSRPFSSFLCALCVKAFSGLGGERLNTENTEKRGENLRRLSSFRAFGNRRDALRLVLRRRAWYIR